MRRNISTILVVDDSFFMRKVICDILVQDTQLRIVGQAASGEEALHKIEELKPDIMTLDIVMPGMGGIDVLRELTKRGGHKPVTVMVSAHNATAGATTLDCLAAGAIDFVLKPSEVNAWRLQDTAEDLRQKVQIALASRGTIRAPSAPAHKPALLANTSKSYRAVVIGSSTGGPVALEQILPQLSKDIDCPIVVAQHMPAHFVVALAERLGHICALPVIVAQDSERLQPGHVYVCPGGVMTSITALPEPQFRMSATNQRLTPSIDTVLSSAAISFKDGLVAIVLTGMGEDSLAGARQVHAHGGTIIVQDQYTSAIFGIGRSVSDAGLADAILPLNDIIPGLLPKLPHR